MSRSTSHRSWKFLVVAILSLTLLALPATPAVENSGLDAILPEAVQELVSAEEAEAWWWSPPGGWDCWAALGALGALGWFGRATIPYLIAAISNPMLRGGAIRLMKWFRVSRWLGGFVLSACFGPNYVY